MMRCLETNKVCPVGNYKCKTCHLEDCKEVLNMIETQEEREERIKLKKLKEQLPEECKQCTVYEVINADKGKIYCPYRIMERCILK